MNTAKYIVDKCGGAAVVAEWLGVTKVSVYRWAHPRSKGGCGGRIPTKHQDDLLKKAREAGVALTPADFFAQQDAAD